MRIRLALTAAVIGLAATLGVVPRGVPATEAAGPGTWTAASDLSASYQSHEAVLLPNGRVLVGANAQTPFSGTSRRYDPVTNAWTTAGTMADVHAYGTLTLLRDGRILAAAGSSITGNLSQAAEIWNANTTSWTLVDDLVTARNSHTATLLPDGRVLVAGGLGPGLNVTTSTEVYDPFFNVWTPAASMNIARGAHAATLLEDGRVLVAGGADGMNNALASAEIYDAVSNTWTFVSPMTTPRLGLQNVLLGDGRVLATGGLDAAAGVPQGAEIYDPDADAWTPTTAMTAPRDAAHTATMLGNGKVLVAGGLTSLTLTEIYDPQTDVWTAAGDLPAQHSNHTATLLHDGRVLVAGSAVVGSTMKASLYDPTAWVPVASPATPRVNHSATLLWNGKALIAGGGSAAAELYDEATNTWSPGGTMSAPRELHAAARLNDGRVLVVGGTNGPWNGSNELLTAEIYTPATNSWSSVANPAFAHGGGSAVVLPDGRVFVYGSNSSGDAEIYTPGTNTWSVTAPNPNAGITGPAYRTSAGRVLTVDFSGTNLYDPITDTWSGPLSYPGPFLPGRGDQLDGSTQLVVAGGNDVCPMAQTPTSKKVVIFDGSTETWMAAAQMAVARNGHSATALYGGKLLVAGGYRSVATCQGSPVVTEASVELYNAATNAWTSAGQMTSARHAHTATRLTSGNVLVVGGRDGVGVVPTAERYDLGIHTDTDGDGYNDGLELALSQHPWSKCKTMRADVSGDGLVNVADLGKVAAQSGKRPPPSRIDQNGDKIINVADLGLTASQSGKSVLSCA